MGKAAAHVAWMGSNQAEPKADGGTATPMLYSRLDDAGTCFEPQRNIIQAHPGLDGGGSVAADPLGNVYVTWHAPIVEREMRKIIAGFGSPTAATILIR